MAVLLSGCIVGTKEFNSEAFDLYKTQLCSNTTVKAFYSVLDPEASSKSDVFLVADANIPAGQEDLLVDVIGLCFDYASNVNVHFPVPEGADPKVKVFNNEKVKARFTILRSKADAAKETLYLNWWLLAVLLLMNTVAISVVAKKLQGLNKDL